MDKPASPIEDLADWQRQRDALSSNALTPELSALAQSGVSVSIAACLPDGRPLVGLGVGCRIRHDSKVRILVLKEANTALLEAVREGSSLAATFVGAPDHRAFQVKAISATISEVCSDDIPELDRQTALFREGLVEIGFSSRLAEGYVSFDPEDLVALELDPERIFTQTPGPGAGAELVR